MKTQLQQLLKLESDLTNMFDSDYKVAMSLLEYIRTNRDTMLENEKKENERNKNIRKQTE